MAMGRYLLLFSMMPNFLMEVEGVFHSNTVFFNYIGVYLSVIFSNGAWISFGDRFCLKSGTHWYMLATTMLMYFT